MSLAVRFLKTNIIERYIDEESPRGKPLQSNIVKYKVIEGNKYITFQVY